MKKSYLLLAAAAMALGFTACSSNDIAEEKTSPQPTVAEESAVLFDAYMNRATTRAGQTGLLTTANLQSGSEADKAKTGGFGVFGYYTNDELYSQNAKPEFFYNQKVYNLGAGAGWVYEPVKYWPNEFGSTAESFGEDKLTFFAYAPYVPVDVNTGIAQTTGSPAEDQQETGIISLTRNTAVGDPYVKYYVDFDPENCVDLCFGVAKENFTNSVDGAKNNVTKGTPYTNVKKPNLGDRINFDFKHALAQLNIQIDADVDEMSHGSTALAANTKIYVREITIEGIADKGMLNLNSEATSIPYSPKWVDLSGINEIKSGKVTIYDGRRDGKEGQPDAKAANEKPQTLNPTIISNDNNTTAGVLGQTKKNVFAGDNANSPVLVIPTGQELGITIVYDVETADNNLATFLSDGQTHGSSVENKIYKNITLSGSNLKLEAGKAYTVNLHLGMTSVKFEASVTDWVDVTPESDVDLPVNAPSTTIDISSPSQSIASVPASASTGVLRVTGLATSPSLEGITSVAASGTGITVTPTSGTATDAGTFDVTYTIAANNTVNEIGARTITVDAATSADVVLTITKQEAAPLGLSIKTPAKAGQNLITLDATAVMAETDWTGATVTVKKTHNGVTSDATVTKGATGSTDKQGTLTLGEAAVAGDLYTITVKAGNAAAETVSYTVVKQSGSISYTNANVNVAVATVNGSAIHQAITKTDGSDGTVTYSIEKTSVAAAAATASIGSDGTVTISGAAANDVFTVTATIADTDNWTFSPKTAIYTITAQ